MKRKNVSKKKKKSSFFFLQGEWSSLLVGSPSPYSVYVQQSIISDSATEQREIPVEILRITKYH